MRSFFSQVLVSNWIFLLILSFTGSILFFSEGVISGDYKIFLFMFYFIFSLFLTFHLSYKLATNVTEKLSLIEKKTMAINAGDFGNLISIDNTKELSDLANSINSMSERLQNQFKDLNSEKEKFNFLLENLKEGVFAISSDKKILFQNSSVPKSLISPNSSAMNISDSVQNKKLLDFLNQHIDSSFEGKLHLESGKRFYKVKFYALKSNPILFIGIITDKTEERETQIFKEKFVQSASHELKTPITSIKGYAETLHQKINPKNDSHEKRFLDAILRNSDRMIRIVDDMLMISKMESHKTFFQPEEIELKDFIEQIQLTVDGFLQLKNQKFKIEIQDDLKLFVDLVLFEHLVLNLVQNASNYSPENTDITFKAERFENSINLEVVDQGIGIEEIHLGRIFERFYRIDHDRSRKTGGTGLGLSIVKHIVNLHSGKIRVESKLSEGSVFKINLPIDKNEFIV